MERFAYANIEECAQEHLVITTDDAVNYLGKKIAGGQAKEYRLNRVNNLLGRVLLPHLGTAPEDRLKKRYSSQGWERPFLLWPWIRECRMIRIITRTSA